MKRYFALRKARLYDLLFLWLGEGRGRYVRWLAWWIGLPIIRGTEFALDGYKVRLLWTRGRRTLPWADP